eukprot:3940920-Rhodomonas_salina.2
MPPYTSPVPDIAYHTRRLMEQTLHRLTSPRLASSMRDDRSPIMFPEVDKSRDYLDSAISPSPEIV